MQAPQPDITGSLIKLRCDLKQSDSTTLSLWDLNRNWVGGDGGGGGGDCNKNSHRGMLSELNEINCSCLAHDKCSVRGS